MSDEETKEGRLVLIENFSFTDKQSNYHIQSKTYYAATLGKMGDGRLIGVRQE